MTPGDLVSPEQCMQYAIDIAYLGRGRVAPNPMVGCVVVDGQHRFLSSGYHARVGEAHAEVNAIDGLTEDQLEGATVYVTLEPCSFEGRTPSCAKTLAKLPIRKVVYGMVDPNPKVQGAGATILQEAGKEVELYSELQGALSELIEIFNCNQKYKRPFVSVKIAATADGRFATDDNQSQWITGSSAREKTHVLRAGHSAVLVGCNTVLQDNPQLNVRYPGLKDIEPHVVVIDPRLRAIHAQLKLFEVHDAEKIIFAHSKELAEVSEKCRILHVDNSADGMDLQDLLSKLYDLGIYSIFIEGGGNTISMFLRSQLVDRLHLFSAPLIMGRGRSWTDDVAFDNPLTSRLELQNVQHEILGDDIYTTGSLDWSALTR